ncbi:MAG: hypothetical protein QY326_01785 [Bdellovibrionota bacterium]|nr:MAG: hypothetical protein QY326_01785 [Bdellovibrionota bacterium]
MKRLLVSFAVTIFVSPLAAWAGDGATIIFKSGQVITFPDGFRQVSQAFRSLDGTKDNEKKVVELNLGGGTYVLQLNDIEMVCRDQCSNATIKHQLAPKKEGPRPQG